MTLLFISTFLHYVILCIVSSAPHLKVEAMLIKRFMQEMWTCDDWMKIPFLGHKKNCRFLKHWAIWERLWPGIRHFPDKLTCFKFQPGLSCAILCIGSCISLFSQLLVAAYWGFCGNKRWKMKCLNAANSFSTWTSYKTKSCDSCDSLKAWVHGGFPMHLGVCSFFSAKAQASHGR